MVDSTTPKALNSSTPAAPHKKRDIWSMERQVRLTAGLLILLGIALACSVNANWMFFSAFVALGMVFSAVTNTCGLGQMLGLMPWNR